MSRLDAEIPTEVALGYPGEVQNGPGARLQWWAFAMIPFSYVVYTLAVGLEEATKKMLELYDAYLSGEKKPQGGKKGRRE